MSVVAETMASSASARKTALRPLALPVEHGGWSMLFEPIVLAILVAPSFAGSLIAAAAVPAFLARHPLRLFVQDMRRRKRFARTPICAWLALAYAGTSSIALFAAATMSGSRVLLPLVAGALLAAIQFALDLRQRGRSFIAEICGAGAAATTAAAIAVASHRSWEVACALALLAASLTLPAILFVRAVLRHERRTTTIVLHSASVIGAAILWQRGLTPAVAIVVMAMLLIRAAAGLQAKATPAAKIIGMREAVAGAAAVLIPSSNPVIGWNATSADKTWGLTDCTSFVIMEQHKIKAALSADRDFQQAGFKALLID